MADKIKRFSGMGAVKRDTNQIIDDTIEKQQEMKKLWAGRRPKTLAISTRRSNKHINDISPSVTFNNDSKRGFVANYWFPLLCAISVIAVATWTFWPEQKEQTAEVATAKTSVTLPQPVVKTVEQKSTKPETLNVPTFDIVRVETGGNVLIAGRFNQGKNISITLNDKIIATVALNSDGEFVYSPKNKLNPGNYTIQLLSGNIKSDKVFLYINENPDQSLSLLMTSMGSRVLQAPENLKDGALVVSQIDYVANKRLIVQGKALPKLRVTMSLNGELLGSARVSDHKNFGLGASVGELTAGKKYVLSVKLHDSSNNVIANIDHDFLMPKMADADKTFYVVRRDDCLWIIARNFLGKGIRFSIIATENKIKNPDLIYPNQKLKIPVKG